MRSPKTILGLLALAAVLLASCNADFSTYSGQKLRAGGTSDEDRDRTRDQNR
jgi:hypothetical protein